MIMGTAMCSGPWRPSLWFPLTISWGMYHSVWRPSMRFLPFQVGDMAGTSGIVPGALDRKALFYTS